MPARDHGPFDTEQQVRELPAVRAVYAGHERRGLAGVMHERLPDRGADGDRRAAVAALIADAPPVDAVTGVTSGSQCAFWRTAPRFSQLLAGRGLGYAERVAHSPPRHYLGVYDHRIAEWLTQWEPQTVAVIAGWIGRAR